MSRRNNIIGSLLNPLYLTPALWIDFSDASTITLNGSTIAQVNDKSGNGRHFVQGTASLQPALITSFKNGHDVARFDGVNDDLLLGSNTLLKNVTGATIYVVRKWAASPTSVQTMFKISTPSSAGRAQIQGGNVSGKNAIGGRTLDADSFVRVDSSSSVTTAWRIQTGVYDYANTDLFQYINESLDGSTTSYQSGTATSNTDSASAVIGGANGISYFNGDIGEVLVYHAAHSADQRQDVWNFLRTKWAI